MDLLCPDRSPADDTGWRQAWLAGEVLIEIGVGVQDTEQGQQLLSRVQQRLTNLLERGLLTPRERAEAGDVLGQLGDPRFDPSRFSLPGAYRGQPEPLAGLVEIPPGPFVLGSWKGDPDDWLKNESGNPATLTIDYRYWLARYPVTVAQFQCFIDGGGYEDSVWWTPTGWSWRQGQWDSQVNEDWFRERLQSRPVALRSTPMDWNGQRTYPNRPVVNVCWFEAMAYCRWLDAQVKAKPILPLPDGYCIRLPTEAEWEKAARCGDSRRYPWGNEGWDETRTNIRNSEIGHPTPVGIYPSGATPTTELHDLSGNVWEWTLSRYRPYPYDPKDGRNDPEAEGRPVVRGGSWDLSQRHARAASRVWDSSDGWGGRRGFRVVLSLANSGF